jgi:photosystem II stability/assembly factor-like uncharacterized protein
MTRVVAFVAFIAISFTFIPIRSAQNTWERANHDEQFVAFRNGRAGEIYALNGQLFRSNDNGSSWSIVFAQKKQTSVAVDSSGVLFASTTTALFRSADGGNNWSDLAFRGCTALEIHNGALYAAADSGLFRTTDQGLNWSRIYPTTIAISKIAFAANGAIFIAQHGALRRLSSDGTNAKVIFPTSGEISSICTTPPMNVYLTIAKDVGGSVEISSDNGSGFVDIGYGSTVMNGVVADSLVWISGYAMKTSPALNPITDISNGLPEAADVRVLAFTPDGRLIVSTDSGIYRTTRSVRSVASALGLLSDVSIFPNPSSGNVSLSFKMRHGGVMSYRLYDQLGRLVTVGKNLALTPGAHQLLLTDLPMTPGQYFCVMNLAGQTSTIGFIRSR